MLKLKLTVQFNYSKIIRGIEVDNYNLLSSDVREDRECLAACYAATATRMSLPEYPVSRHDQDVIFGSEMHFGVFGKSTEGKNLLAKTSQENLLNPIPVC